jgi:hypothetical protein
MLNSDIHIGHSRPDRFAFTPVTPRYVRLYMTQRATILGDSLYSFDIYAK